MGRKRKLNVARYADGKPVGRDASQTIALWDAVHNSAGLFRPVRTPRKPVVYDPREMRRTMGLREVDRRIMRACKTIRVLPEADKRFRGTATMQSSVWTNVIHDFMDAYASEEVRYPRFVPTPSDVSDCLTALGWCNALEKNEFKLVWWRSFELSFGQIAARIGRSDETARRRYSDAIKKAWYVAVSEA